MLRKMQDICLPIACQPQSGKKVGSWENAIESSKRL
jgi:hypothetical protein